ncbi:MAG: transcription elongation factor GreA [Thermodesulfobacteriota bacterium]|nr:transcription elongation factor GreA [Thermodesulfobacteriota bacterium]
MRDKVYMTEKGYGLLKEELKRLKAHERPKVIKDLAEARAHGDLSENAEYDAAKERQAFVEGKIKDIEGKLAYAEVIKGKQGELEKVVFGSNVRLFDLKSEEEVTYQIVGEDEADIKDGMISIHSPVARAVIGKTVGEEVVVNVPKGIREFEILKIFYEE